LPGYERASARWKSTRSATPDSAARARAASIDSSCVSTPTKRERANADRHQHRRMAVAAADVRDARSPLELLDDAVERGQPLGDERRRVRVPIEARDAA
jgi:hypothetical protein